MLLAQIRSQNLIALALTSSGIAATLLDSGRTAHSTLKFPLNIQFVEAQTYNIPKGSDMAKVLQTCKLIGMNALWHVKSRLKRLIQLF